MPGKQTCVGEQVNSMSAVPCRHWRLGEKGGGAGAKRACGQRNDTRSPALTGRGTKPASRSAASVAGEYVTLSAPRLSCPGTLPSQPRALAEDRPAASAPSTLISLGAILARSPLVLAGSAAPSVRTSWDRRGSRWEPLRAHRHPGETERVCVRVFFWVWVWVWMAWLMRRTRARACQ